MRAIETFFRLLVRRVLGTDEVQRLLRTCPGSSWASVRNRAVLVTFLDTGVRLGELVHLSAEEVDTRTGTIRIRNGKGGKDRRVFPGRAALRDVCCGLDRRGPHGLRPHARKRTQGPALSADCSGV